MEEMNLEKMCLSHIIQNFDVFNAAYLTSKNPSLQRNLEFLQRGYSAKLIKLFGPRELKPEYLDFLINRHLKEMDFRRFKHHCWEELTDRVKKIAKGLEKVYLERKMVRESPQKTKEIMQLLQNVKYLNIPFGCEDETIQNISRRCLNLKELHVGYVGIASDERERCLCGARFGSPGPRCLWVLRISRSEIKTSTVASILKNISTLEIFNYLYLPRVLLAMHYYDLVDKKLPTVKKYSLTELDFRSSTPYEIDLLLAICTVLCPNVRKLSIGIAWQGHVHAFNLFSKLECLTIHTFSNRNAIILDDFLKIKGSDLISLDIRGHFSVSIPVLIENCQKLEKLHMKIVDHRCVFEECMPTLKDMKGVTESTKKVCLPTLKHLKELIIYTFEAATPLTTEAVCLILNSSPNIENMCILYGIISDSQLKTTLLNYCELNTLKYLYLGFSGIDVNFLQIILKSCASLQRLNVRFCKNIYEEEFEILLQTASTTKNKPQIVWYDFDSFIDECDIYSSEENFDEDL